MSVLNNLNRLCRLCANKCRGINVFSDEGVRYKLESKIKRYLSIQIIKEDPLPKVICASCKVKIDNHHEFASTASKIQDKLSSYLASDCDESSSVNGEGDGEGEDDVEDDEENGSDEEVDSDKEDEPNNIEFSGSLLHSILTTGREEMDLDQNSEVMEVEVKIDPMLFLSGQDDNSVDTENSKDMAPNDNHSANSKKNDISEDETNHTDINKPYKCSICPRGFNSEISLQNHLWSHFSRKILSNSHFNSRLRSKSKGSVYSLNGVMHAVSDLPNNHPYVCPICGRQISTKGNLKVHLETHRPKGKYDCDICGRIFKTQSNLYRHKEYHAGVQFTCEVCSRVYPTKSTLRAHSITHSDLRPHQCPLCDKTFKRNQDLKFHINQHTGARPYKCPFCPKAFASSGNCFSHRKRMHPGEVQLDKYKGLSGILVQ